MFKFLMATMLCLPALASANVLGSFQTFSPTSDQFYFETVNSSKTLQPGWINLGFYGTHAKNSLLVYSTVNGESTKLNYKDSMQTYDLIVGFGLQKNLHGFIQVPGILSQAPDAGQNPSVSLPSGISTLRPGVKWDISQKRTGGWALVGSIDFPMMKDDPYVGTSPKPILNVEGVYDIRTERDAMAFNVGYRKRTAGGLSSTAAMWPLKDQLTASVGYTRKVSNSLWWVTEALSSYPINKDPYDKASDISSMELLGSIRYEPELNLIAHLGGTLEAIPGGMAPSYRLFGGLNYYFGMDNKSRNSRRGFVVNPGKLRMRPSQTYQFSTKGNIGRVKYEVLSGAGDIDPDSGLYKSPPQPGAARIRATDEDGNYSDATIFIRDVKQMRVEPQSTVLFEGELETFSTDGGAPPYTYSLSDGFGKIDNETGDYTAPSHSGEVYVISTDSTGRTAQAKVRVKGAPRPSAVLTLKDLQFGFNSDKLTAAGREKLEKSINDLRNMQIRALIVEGHSDNVGDDAYNLKLSGERAETVKAILVESIGLDPEQIRAVGFGKEKPVSPNDTEEGRQNNRRVELKIYKDKTLQELER